VFDTSNLRTSILEYTPPRLYLRSWASLARTAMAALSAACPLGATHALRGTAVAVRAPPAAASCATRGAPLRVRAGNDYENGVFTPLVIVVRNVMGVKPFNQFRGKAISLHSQVRRAPRRGGGEGTRRFGNLVVSAPRTPFSSGAAPASSVHPKPHCAPRPGGRVAASAARTRAAVLWHQPPLLRSRASLTAPPQVITEFCKSIGADVKVRQGLIRLAKKNGASEVSQARAPTDAHRQAASSGSCREGCVFWAEAASKGRTCTLRSAPGRSAPVRVGNGRHAGRRSKSQGGIPRVGDREAAHVIGVILHRPGREG